MKEQIRLSQESIDWAIEEGTEIFKNSASLRRDDTLMIKIRNSIFGAFGQQALIDHTGGRRVTKEEVPGFWYDVLVPWEKFYAYTGMATRVAADGTMLDVRVEVKTIRMVNRSGKWVSLYENFLHHAIKSARADQLDYIMVYGVHGEINTDHSAEIELLGVVSAKAFSRANIDFYFPRSTFWDDANPRTQMRYFNKRHLHEDRLGKIFI